jgi:drug/metabolite transporter (DMT)-like permease
LPSTDFEVARINLTAPHLVAIPPPRSPIRPADVSRRGWLLFAAMCVIWGIPYLLIKVAVRALDPATLVFARTAIGAALLLPLAAAKDQLLPLLSKWRPLVAYTIIEIAGPWWLLSSAERRLPSSLSGLLVAAVPLVGAVLAVVLPGSEPLNRRVIIGLIVGLGGVVALVGLDVGHADLGPVGAVGLVVIGYAVGPVILSRSLADLPGLGVVAASLGLCALAYAPVVVAHHPERLPGGRVIAAVAVLGIVCTALAFVLFLRLIAEIGPLRATVITYVNPAVAVTLGIGFLHEKFSLGTGIGFVLILSGCTLATRRPSTMAPLPGGDSRERRGTFLQE